MFVGVRANYEIKLFLNRVKIESKFFGVIINHKFIWKPHIEYKKTLFRSIGIVSKAGEFFEQVVELYLRILYFSLIIPYMSYCVFPSVSFFF